MHANNNESYTIQQDGNGDNLSPHDDRSIPSKEIQLNKMLEMGESGDFNQCGEPENM